MVFQICVRQVIPITKFYPKLPSLYLKMTDAALLNRVKTNAINAELEVKLLKEQLEELIKQNVDQRIAKLKVENCTLSNEVNRLITELTALETSKGITQIPIPGGRKICTDITKEQVVVSQPEKPQSQPEISEDASTKTGKDKKKDKQSVAKAAKTPKEPKEAAPEPNIDVGRLDFRVGKIIEVSKHPDANSLYVEKVDCGEANPRTVVSGLVKFVPLEEMQNRMVVLLCNLKPAKMRGVLSEAMVMCASTPEHVEVLSPPEGSVPGDLVHCEGFPRVPDSQLNPKKKIFETVAPDLLTNDNLVACYKGNALHVPGKGNVIAKTLKNVNVK